MSTKTVKLSIGQANILSSTQKKKKELEAAIAIINEKEELVALLVAEGAGILTTEIAGATFVNDEIVFTLKSGETPQPKADKKVKKLKAVETVE